MDFKQLQYFVQTYRDGSLSKAARNLAITQPALSQQIAKLERELGYTLLERNSREMRVTPKGKILLKHAVQIQDSMQELIREVRDISELDQISIAAGGAVSSWVLPRMIAYLKERHPGTAFQVLEGDDQFVTQALMTGMVDIAVSSETFPTQGMVVEYLCSDRIVPVVSKTHPLALKSQMKLSDIAKTDLLLYHQKSAIQKIIAEKFLSIPEIKQCHVSMVLRSLISLIKSVEAGIGIGFISNLAVNENLAVLPLKRLTCERQFYLKYREARKPLIEPFVKEMISYSNDL